MANLPTIKIEANNPRGWCIINASDFDPTMHRRFDAPKSSDIPTTPDDVAKMKKADVIEMLEAHGAEFDATAKVGDLRDQLSAVMFTGI